MDRLFEFVVNHYILVSLFVAFLVAILILESRRGGAKISAQAAVSLINRDEALVVDIRDERPATNFFSRIIELFRSIFSWLFGR